MRHFSWVVGPLIAAGISFSSVSCIAQAKMTTVSDAQVESDVLKALAGNQRLADQAITSNTVYGTVTLSGSVRDEDLRKLAETVVSRTSGVKKVIDELTLGEAPVAVGEGGPGAVSDNSNATNPVLQSDGTMAVPNQQAPGPVWQENAQPSQDPYRQQSAVPQQPNGEPPADSQRPYNQSPPPPPGYGQQSQGQQSQGQPFPGQAESGQPRAQNGGTDPYGQQPQPNYAPPYRRGYNQPPYGPPTPGYGQSGSGSAPYGAQAGGQQVTVPSGSMLRIRINQGLDSGHMQPGTSFDAVVLNDVVADGFVAVPRGATVQGTIVDAQRAGALKGRGQISLRLTQLTLAGRTYPIASDVWSNYGDDKTVRTVNSALGLGAVGAIIGGVAGGGAGAAIGAGVGGAAGVGASAASGGGQAYIPSEAILTFHLTQPAALATVSQAEMDRLGYGVPLGAQRSSQMRRRYVRPVPYGYPVFYPRYPYPYPY